MEDARSAADSHAWEQKCKQLLAIHYGDELQLIDASRVGDLGIEAFTRDTGRAFQCYARHLGMSRTGLRLPACPLACLSQVDVGGGAGLGSDESDVLLGIEAALTIAPGAQVVVYDGPSTGSGAGFQALFNKMINDGLTVISQWLELLRGSDDARRRQEHRCDSSDRRGFAYKRF